MTSCRPLLRRTFLAFARGDAERFVHALRPGAQVTLHGPGPSLERLSAREFVERWGGLPRDASRARTEIHAVLGGSTHEVVVLRRIEIVGDVVREYDVIHLCEVRDGALSAIRVYPSSLAAASWVDDVKQLG